MTPTDDLNGSRDPLVAAPGEDFPLDEAHLRLLLDAIPTPVSYVDRGLRFRYNNRAALGVDDADRADALAKGLVGKRLTYRRHNEPDIPF